MECLRTPLGRTWSAPDGPLSALPSPSPSAPAGSSAWASLIRCHDATCTTADDIDVASDGFVPDVAVTIGADGTPSLAYFDVGGPKVAFASLWWATGGR
ncbi:MAG: hypothetical protein ACO35E_05910 [Ilumatobacteraceae bacterium]